MRPIILLSLAYATLCLAVPPPKTALSTRIFPTSLNSLYDESSLSVSSRQSGLNFSPCSSDAECVGDRDCRTTSDDNQLVPCPGTGTGPCVCFPVSPSDFFCSSSSECDAGESCAEIPNTSQTACIADEIIRNLGLTTTDDDDTTDDGTGLTGESCSDDSDCRPGLVCTSTSTGQICASGTTAPTTTAPTTSVPVSTPVAPVTSEPSTSEVASTTTAVTTTTETSDSTTTAVTTTTETSDSDTPSIFPVSDTDSDSDDETNEEQPPEDDSNVPSGLTADPCQSSDDCQGSRTCLNLENASPCNEGGCRCLPDSVQPCSDDSSCVEGEGCFSIEEIVDIPFLPDEVKQARVCASRAAREAAVCIGTHSLGHISRKDLVFEKDATAHVLCDSNDSCATPGHMVQYKGNGMMMRSYCEMAGCVRKVMRVNSPKYRRGLIVPSKTEDLVFTALAARFESRAEEGVLSAAVRLGF